MAALLPEPIPTGVPLVIGVEPPGEPQEAELELRGRHVQGLKVDVEEAAALPGTLLEEPALLSQPLVERGAREGRHDGDLDVELPALADEGLDGIEDPGSVTIEPEDEAAVDGDAVGLDSADVVPVVVEPRPFPVPALLDTIDAGRTGALEPDEELPAAGLAHQVEQLRVVGDRDVALAEPVDALRRQRPQQLLGVAAIGEAVVVGELDERMGPEPLDLPDLGQHPLDRLHLIVRRQGDRRRAELALPGAASL